MGKRILLLLAAGCLFTFVSCSSAWKPIHVSTEKVYECSKFGSFPQMIKLPLFHQAWQIVYDCDQYRREPVSIALSLFYSEWHRKFGDPARSLRNTLDKLLIDWAPRDKKGNAFDMTGSPVYGASFGGTTLTPTLIWVKPKFGTPICETSFIHELVHVAIWNTKGTDGDPDHLGKKFVGWTVDHSALVQKVNNQLCSLGI